MYLCAPIGLTIEVKWQPRSINTVEVHSSATATDLDRGSCQSQGAMPTYGKRIREQKPSP